MKYKIYVMLAVFVHCAYAAEHKEVRSQRDLAKTAVCALEAVLNHNPKKLKSICSFIKENYGSDGLEEVFKAKISCDDRAYCSECGWDGFDEASIFKVAFMTMPFDSHQSAETFENCPGKVHYYYGNNPTKLGECLESLACDYYTLPSVIEDRKIAGLGWHQLRVYMQGNYRLGSLLKKDECIWVPFLRVMEKNGDDIEEFMIAEMVDVPADSERWKSFDQLRIHVLKKLGRPVIMPVDWQAKRAEYLGPFVKKPAEEKIVFGYSELFTA